MTEREREFVERLNSRERQRNRDRKGVYRKTKTREIKGKSDRILCKDNETYYPKRSKWLLDFQIASNTNVQFQNSYQRTVVLEIKITQYKAAS